MFDTNYKEKAEKIEKWLKNTVKDAGFKKVVIALSGGIDSAVSTTLAVRVLGKENVTVLLMPYGLLSEKGTKDAKDVATSLEIPAENIIVQDIKKAVDEILKSLQDKQVQDDGKKDSSPSVQNDTSFHSVQAKNEIASSFTPHNDVLRKGNVMARVRMIYLYDLAKKLQALVVGTENKSEYYLSYFTRFGDEASDIEPIRNLYKTQVWEMGKYLGVAQQIIEKAPTAGLWDSQTDEGEFGFSYLDADRVLYHHFDEELPIEAIVELGVPKQVVEDVLSWVAKNDFKHHLPKIFE